MINQVQIFHRKGVFPAIGTAADLSIAGMEAQTAHLSTGASVAGAVLDCLTHQALTAVADTERPITEHFNFNPGLNTFPNDFNRCFSGKNCPRSTLFLHKLTAGWVMNMHLGGTMHFKIRVFLAYAME